MSAGLAKLDRFIGRWREPLERQASVLFEARSLDDPTGTPAAIADRLVQSLGLLPIAPHWEMLDDGDDHQAPRSAIAAFAEALANDMVVPRESWLGPDAARRCGLEFIAAFEPLQRTILTNRMYFGWNPISTAAFEWAFVGFDDHTIALLLLTADD